MVTNARNGSSGRPGTGSDLVVVAEHAQDALDWAALVGDVGRALALAPTVEHLPIASRRAGAVDQLLARASQWPGPVLVLPGVTVWRGNRAPSGAGADPRGPACRDGPPAGGDGTAEGDGQVGLHRVLIPSDASPAVAVGVRMLCARLGRAGVRATVLHVLTESNQPRMWEGPGHHAKEWFAEMRRRHGTPTDALTVVSGEPEVQMRAYAAGADLVVLLWGSDSHAGHATVIRSLLGRAIEVPHLLVRLAWMAEFGSSGTDTAHGRRATDA